MYLRCASLLSGVAKIYTKSRIPRPRRVAGPGLVCEQECSSKGKGAPEHLVGACLDGDVPDGEDRGTAGAYSKHPVFRKGGLAGLGSVSNSELTVGSVSNCVSYSFFLLTKRLSEPFLI